MRVVKPDTLRILSAKILAAAGTPKGTAALVAEMLTRSNLCGVDSHGVMRVPEYLRYIDERKVRPAASPAIVRETETTATLDGRMGFGQVTGIKAMKMAISKAKKGGLAAVTCYNTTHLGRLADYPQLAVENDMIGALFVKAPVIVAPWGGRERLLGTNPISFGIPAGKEDPIIADFATSTSAEGKLRIKRNHGEKLPVGWIIDSRGRPSVDPGDFYAGGALLPFGAFKGYAISLLGEALGGALTGQEIADEFKSINGACFLAVSVGYFTPLRTFKDRIDRLIRKMRNCEPAEGFSEVLLPGELEAREMKRRLRTGIPLDDNIWDDLLDCARRFHISTKGTSS